MQSPATCRPAQIVFSPRVPTCHWLVSFCAALQACSDTAAWLGLANKPPQLVGTRRMYTGLAPYHFSLSTISIIIFIIMSSGSATGLPIASRLLHSSCPRN